MATHKQDHRPTGETHAVDDLNEVPPEGIEPDLTPAPGQDKFAGGTAQAPVDAAPADASTQRPDQQQTLHGQSQTLPGMSQRQGTPDNDLGFDPDSPDLADPQVDPIGAAQIPDEAPGVQVNKRVNDDQYPPYNR